MGLYGACTFSEHHMEFGQGVCDSAAALGDGGKQFKISVGSYVIYNAMVYLT